MRRFRLLALMTLLLISIACGLRLRPVFGQSGHDQSTMTLYATYQFHTLNHPTGLAASLWGNNTFDLFIADSSNNLIRKFEVPSGGAGTLSSLAGNGTAGYIDGATNSAEFNDPTDLIGGVSGYLRCIPGCNCQLSYCWQPAYYTLLYVNDAQNYVVRKICSGPLPPSTGACNSGIANTVSTVAGNHTQGYLNGSSLSAEFSVLLGLFGKASTPSSSTPFYLADGANNVVRSWDGANVSTFAGSGSRGLVNGYRTSAQFGTPVKAAWDTNGNMYVTDTDNYVIRKIDTAGYVTTFAGTGQPGLVNGPGSQAQFRFSAGIVFNPADNYLYVADAHNNVIRRIDLAGNVSTYAGTGVAGLTNGSLSQAQFSGPTNLLIRSGIMYVSDTLNNVIRRIDMSSGVVSTYIS